MIVVIDGYNLLRAIFPKEKGKLDKQRDKLIRQLGFYKSQRENIDIIVVFDGGLWSRATREVKGGVVVIFSGQKQSADDWIIDYFDRNKEKELMLVTRDRELIEKCRNRKVEVLKGVDFYDIMQKRLLEGVAEELVGGGVKKYETEIKSEALDRLMEQAPLELYEKEDFLEEKKKGGHTLSKKEKQRRSKLKKL